MNRIKLFIKDPVTIISLIMLANSAVFSLSIFLPTFWCLLTLWIMSIAVTILLAYIWGSKDAYKQRLELERSKNSSFIDELLIENTECHRELAELSNEREFLLEVLERYDVKKIN